MGVIPITSEHKWTHSHKRLGCLVHGDKIFLIALTGLRTAEASVRLGGSFQVQFVHFAARSASDIFYPRYLLGDNLDSSKYPSIDKRHLIHYFISNAYCCWHASSRTNETVSPSARPACPRTAPSSRTSKPPIVQPPGSCPIPEQCWIGCIPRSPALTDV